MEICTIVLKSGENIDFPNWDREQINNTCREVMKGGTGWLTMDDDDDGEINTIIKVSEIAYVGINDKSDDE